MPLPLPVGEYRIAAWAGVSDDFEIPELVPENLTGRFDSKNETGRVIGA